MSHFKLLRRCTLITLWTTPFCQWWLQFGDQAMVTLGIKIYTLLSVSLSYPPWTERRSNQSVLKEINPESSLNTHTHWKNWCWRWRSSILVSWCEKPTYWKSPWCWERLRAEGEEGIRGWDGCTVPPKQWIQTWARECECELWEMVRGREPGVLQSVPRSQTWLGDWTTTMFWHLQFTK